MTYFTFTDIHSLTTYSISNRYSIYGKSVITMFLIPFITYIKFILFRTIILYTYCICFKKHTLFLLHNGFFFYDGDIKFSCTIETSKDNLP